MVGATVTFSSLNSTGTAVYVETILPLTTTFTPEPECTDTLTMNGFSPNTQLHSLFGGGAYPTSGGAFLPASCFPPGFGDLATATRVATYYSPGICPHGYTQNTSSVVSTPTLDLRSGERTALCCPKGYALNLSPPGGIYLLPPCESTLARDTTAVGSYSGTMSIETVHSGATATASAIEIRWRKGDFRGNRISKSGVIAISVVIPLVALGSLIFAIFCLLRRRQRKPGPGKPGPDNTPSDLPELVTYKTAPTYPILVEENEMALPSAEVNSATEAASLGQPPNIREAEGRNLKAAEESQSSSSVSPGGGNAAVEEPLGPPQTRVPTGLWPEDGGKEVVEELPSSPEGKPSPSGVFSASAMPGDALQRSARGDVSNSSKRPIPSGEAGPASLILDKGRERLALERQLEEIQAERERREIEQLRRKEEEIKKKLRKLNNS